MTDQRPALTPALCYRDPRAALDFLERAFGFEREMVIEDADGGIAHAEMRFSNGLIMLGGEWSEKNKSPVSTNGVNTQSVHIQVLTDIDAHCARARAAGAVIAQEPSDQFYGDRTYRAIDPEGHVWTFGQPVTEMAPEEWDKAMGFKTTIYT